MDEQLDAYPKPFSLSFVDDDDDPSGLYNNIQPATQEPLSQLDSEFHFQDNYSQATDSVPMSYFDGEAESETNELHSVLSILDSELNFKEDDYAEDNLPIHACR